MIMDHLQRARLWLWLDLAKGARTRDCGPKATFARNRSLP
jgi:hypothetical protein